MRVVLKGALALLLTFIYSLWLVTGEEFCFKKAGGKGQWIFARFDEFSLRK
jgi:hypothetical protein